MSNSSDPMDYSLPGSSVHGIFQARVLEWGATAFSRTTDNHWQIQRRRKGNLLIRKMGKLGAIVLTKESIGGGLGSKVWRLLIGWAATVSDWWGYGPGRG